MSLLPSFNRRRLLIGLGIASAAATVATVPALGSVPEAEEPELIRLGDTLPAVVAEYASAYAEESSILATWGKRWPLAPDVLTKPGSLDDLGPIERGLTGAGLHRPGEEYCRRIIHTPESTAREVSMLRKALARKRKHPDAPINWLGEALTLKEWSPVLAEKEARLAAAEAYEAEKARILAASGYAAANARHSAAAKALHALIEAIVAIKPRGMSGVIIQAEALAAWARVEPWRQILNPEARHWGAAFAASVIRIAEEAPAQQA